MRKYILFELIVLVFSFILVLFTDLNKILITDLTVIVIFYLLYSRKVLSPTNLSLAIISVSLFIFNMFGLNNYFAGNLEVRLPFFHITDDYIVSWCSEYSALVITCLLFGALVAEWDTPKACLKYICNVKHNSFSFYCIVGFLPVIANYILFILVFRGSDYVSIHQAGQSSIKYLMFTIFFTYAALLILLRNYESYTVKQRKLIIVLILLTIVLYGFFYNTRSNILVILLYLLYFFRHKISVLSTLIASFVSILLFITITIIRGAGTNTSFYNAFIFNIVGMGGFTDMMAYSKQYVDNYGLLFGSSYLLGLFDPSYKLANWYAEESAFDFYSSGGGFGFYYLAELLVNFGYLGSLFAAFCLSFILFKISIRQNRFIKDIIAPSLLGYIIPLIRNDWSAAIKGPFYVILSVCILYAINGMLKTICSGDNKSCTNLVRPTNN